METTGDHESRRPSAGHPSTGSGERTGRGAEAEDPGAWSTAALTLLITLFLLATVATVHSMIVTFGG